MQSRPAEGGSERVRRLLEQEWVEKGTVALVLLYMLLVLLDLALDGVRAWAAGFIYADLVLLCVFAAEHAVRLYAYGSAHLRSPTNLFDISVVLVSLAFQLHYVASGAGEELSFLGVLRLVRLVRIVAVMRKIQEQRDAAKAARQLKLGSPVERVLELLNEMKDKVASRPGSEALVRDIEGVLELIVSEKLYKIDLSEVHGGKVGREMNAFLDTMGMQGSSEPSQGHGRSSVQAQGRRSVMQLTAERRASRGELGGERKSSGSPRAESYAELSRVESILREPAVCEALAQIHDWGVDVFAFHEAACGSGLVVAAVHLLEYHGLVNELDLDLPRMAAYFRRIQDGYKDNPYHSCVHALDVMLNTSYFIRQEAIAQLLTPLDQLAALLAAAIHDHEHPGVNNNFLVATRHEWAIRYNDQSVLEAHHVASSWALLMRDEYNFVAALPREQLLSLRELVLQLVLATDMRHHFEHTARLCAKCSADALSPTSREDGMVPRDDVRFLLCVVVHAADISNGLKPQALSLRWALAVMEEFFRQGDLEATLGLPISPFYDRATTSIAAAQIGFLNVVVRPYFEPLCAFLGPAVTAEVFHHLVENVRVWEEQGNALISTSTRKVGGGGPIGT